MNDLKDNQEINDSISDDLIDNQNFFFGEDEI